MLTTIVRAQKPCCGNCASGRPCCSKPKPRPTFFRSRSGLWLPRPGLDLPKALLRGGYPSEAEWSGLWRPWQPALMPVQFDLSCLPCCSAPCSCHDIPGNLNAEVTATTGLCGGLLGCSTTITETSPSIWTGSLSTCGCTIIGLQLSCGTDASCADGENYYTLGTTGCGAVSGPYSVCGTCNPLDVSFVVDVPAMELPCNCCGGPGPGTGGTFTVTITE